MVLHYDILIEYLIQYVYYCVILYALYISFIHLFCDSTTLPTLFIVIINSEEKLFLSSPNWIRFFFVILPYTFIQMRHVIVVHFGFLCSLHKFSEDFVICVIGFLLRSLLIKFTFVSRGLSQNWKHFFRHYIKRHRILWLTQFTPFLKL